MDNPVNPVNPAPTGAPVPQRLVKRRSIVVCLLLSLITCGIYGLFWLYSLTEDVKVLSGDLRAPTGGVVILLSIITCSIYQWFWLYKQGDRLDRAAQARGLPAGNSGVLYLVLAIFGLSIVSWALMQDKVNQMAQV